MTYTTPQLALIGQATGVVLVKGAIASGSASDHMAPTPVSYDSNALLETEW